MKLYSYTYDVKSFWQSLAPEICDFTEKEINLCFNSESTISFFKEVWRKKVAKKFFEENPEISDVLLWRNGKKEWLNTKLK